MSTKKEEKKEAKASSAHDRESGKVRTQAKPKEEKK